MLLLNPINIEIMENQIKINVLSDFSPYPGARFESDGPFSGEEFYNKLLKPKMKEALEKKTKLIINLDGTNGYASSFIDQAFGVMLRGEFNQKDIDETIEYISEEEPNLIKIIKEDIIKAKGKKNDK